MTRPLPRWWCRVAHGRDRAVVAWQYVYLADRVVRVVRCSRCAQKATQTATLATEAPHTSLRVERESGSRLSESNRRPIHYE